MLLQDEAGGENGQCECLSSFVEQADRTCVSAIPLSAPHTADGQPGSSGDNSSSGVVAASLSILALIVMAALAMLALRRYRLLPRLKVGFIIDQ